MPTSETVAGYSVKGGTNTSSTSIRTSIDEKGTAATGAAADETAAIALQQKEHTQQQQQHSGRQMQYWNQHRRAAPDASAPPPRLRATRLRPSKARPPAQHPCCLPSLGGACAAKRESACGLPPPRSTVRDACDLAAPLGGARRFYLMQVEDWAPHQRSSMGTGRENGAAATSYHVSPVPCCMLPPASPASLGGIPMRVGGLGWPAARRSRRHVLPRAVIPPSCTQPHFPIPSLTLSDFESPLNISARDS